MLGIPRLLAIQKERILAMTAMTSDQIRAYAAKKAWVLANVGAVLGPLLASGEYTRANAAHAAVDALTIAYEIVEREDFRRCRALED
jgi:hypothetical protein